MTEVTGIQAPPRTLAKATAIAGGAAAITLVLFVLPAETGIDVTGLGRVMGLTQMADGEEPDDAAEAGEQAAAASTAADPGAVEIPAQTQANIHKATAMRSDEITVNLAPHSEIEVKANMAKGDSFVFRWEATGGPVKSEMHGEPVNAKPNEFTTYWKDGAQTSAQGVFVAPFAGTQGWYWRNKGDVPVAIKLTTSGFYKDIVKKGGG